eukprot:TRINITY_DN1008_c0_g1_i2.p1 TRINITY_DN1008_c0_g1~~TRINITY_DN1008_c0_g1_i2.p1  ORF type:complete len:207 (+),score=51.13 TRINITY_DN1008_c0_g1_i2:520-1140(+)
MEDNIDRTHQKLIAFKNMTGSDFEMKKVYNRLNTDFNKFCDAFRVLSKNARKDIISIRIPKKKAYSSGNHNDVYADPTDYDESESLIQKQKEHVRLENEKDFQDFLINERDKEMRNIRDQMLLTNETFTYLAQEIEAQGGIVDNIQTNIMKAGSQVSQGVQHVNKANEHDKSARNKLCFLAVFITIVVAVTTIIVVIEIGLKRKSN